MVSLYVCNICEVLSVAVLCVMHATHGISIWMDGRMDRWMVVWPPMCWCACLDGWLDGLIEHNDKVWHVTVCPCAVWYGMRWYGTVCDVVCHLMVCNVTVCVARHIGVYCMPECA